MLDLIDLARSENVVLFCLTPHCTHALQPLDVSVFKSLKAHFSRALLVFSFTKKDFVITKRDIARIVKEPFKFHFQCPILNIISANVASFLLIAMLLKVLRCFHPKCIKVVLLR